MEIIEYLRAEWHKRMVAAAYSDMDYDFPPKNDNDEYICIKSSGKGFTITNKRTGKTRQIVSDDGWLLVRDSEIKYTAIKKGCPDFNGLKRVDYHFDAYDGFKKGICALCWTVYPDGRYFEDEDGFGAESNKEELAYCIINSDLKIIVPFQPMDDVKAVLKRYRYY